MHSKKTLREALRNYRLTHNLSYRALSEITGVPAMTLHGIVHRGVGPNERTRHLIENKLPDLYCAA